MKSFHTLRLGAVALWLTLFQTASPTVAADYGGGVTAKVLTRTTRTGNGQKISYPCTDRAEVTAVGVELAPGSETGWHKHPVPVYAYVVAGTLVVELEDGRRLTFSAGDAIIEVVDTLHNGRNLGKEPVKLAVFYLGEEGKATVVKGEPSHATGLP